MGTGVRFIAIGVVTPDPASVESILAWANRLQDRVDYVIVENATSTLSDFTYWRSTEQAKQFREAFDPAVLQMEFRLAELENPVRQHGIKLGDVADRKAGVDELKRASLTFLVQRSSVGGRIDEVKTEYSKDYVPLDLRLEELLLRWRSFSTYVKDTDWVFRQSADRKAVPPGKPEEAPASQGR